VTYKGLDIVNR